MLDQHTIQRLLQSLHFNQPFDLHVLETVDSTNQFLKDFPIASNVTICCAESQTQGRGRFGRYWHSPFAKNIYFSIRYQFNCTIENLAGLSLVVSLAIVKMLKNFWGTAEIQIKWPNDLIWQDKKLAGTLIELIGTQNSTTDLIVGIGINVNSMGRELTTQLERPSCSLYDITQQTIDRNMLIAQLIVQLHHDFQQLVTQGFASFIRDWESLDYLHGKPIAITQPTGILSGLACGVNEAGLLKVCDTSGMMHYLSAGETSLR